MKFTTYNNNNKPWTVKYDLMKGRAKVGENSRQNQSDGNCNM